MKKPRQKDEIAEKKTQAYDLLRQITALSQQANVLREKLNAIEQEIFELEKTNERT